MVRHAGLHGDHAHRVRDHIVKVPGDPEPLLTDRPAALVCPLLGEALGLLELGLTPCAERTQVLPGQPGHRDGEYGADPRGGCGHARRLQREGDDQSDHPRQIDHNGPAATHMQADPEHQSEGGVPRERAEPPDRIGDQRQVRDDDRRHREPPVDGEWGADRARQQVGDDRRR